MSKNDLLFGPTDGLFADRRNKRWVLFVTQTLSGALAAVLTAAHVIQVCSGDLLALSLGFVRLAPAAHRGRVLPGTGRGICRRIRGSDRARVDHFGPR